MRSSGFSMCFNKLIRQQRQQQPTKTIGKSFKSAQLSSTQAQHQLSHIDLRGLPPLDILLHFNDVNNRMRKFFLFSLIFLYILTALRNRQTLVAVVFFFDSRVLFKFRFDLVCCSSSAASSRFDLISISFSFSFCFMLLLLLSLSCSFLIINLDLVSRVSTTQTEAASSQIEYF